MHPLGGSRGGSYLSNSGSSTALKRLMHEYRELSVNPVEGIVAGPVQESNFFDWEAMIMGPEGTIYENGVFVARLYFPSDYPHNPPKMVFSSQMWHPNVYTNGEVCISILHPPGEDPNHYESSTERWSPVQSVEKILISVVSMLAEPNIESPANIDAAKMYRDHREEYEHRVKDTVMKTLSLI